MPTLTTSTDNSLPSLPASEVCSTAFHMGEVGTLPTNDGGQCRQASAGEAQSARITGMSMTGRYSLQKQQAPSAAQMQKAALDQ